MNYIGVTLASSHLLSMVLCEGLASNPPIMIRTLIDCGDNDSMRFDISTYGPKGTVNWTTSEWLTLWYLAGLV
jgi:hypothetical protein